MAYTKTIWVNDNEPDIDADNLNKMEQGIYDGQLNAEWGNITGSIEDQTDIADVLPSVGAEAQNNISFIHTPNNYYDSVDIIEDKILNSTGTALEDAEGWFTTDFIKVVSGNKYEFDAEGLTEGDIVWEYNANKEPITSTSLTTHYQVITMNANTKYVRLSVGTYYYMVDTPLIQNKIVVDNEKFTDTLNIGTQAEDKYGVNLLYSRNLFDRSMEYVGKLTSSSTGELVSVSVWNSSNYIDVKPNTNYSISLETMQNTQLCFTEYNSSKTMVARNLLDFNQGDKQDIKTITTTSTTKYLIISYRNDTTTGNIMLTKGNTHENYEPYVVPSINVDGEEIYNQGVMNYSTEEQVIGKWIDGKPIYRKVVDFGALPNATSKSVAHNITNISYITNIKGTALQSNATNFILLPTNYINSINVGNINVQISTNNDLSAFDKCYLTIEYTKTTD